MKKSFFRYLIELCIIIFGITVSFILNEWREGKKIQQTNLNLLAQIHTDLAQDSMLIAQRIQSIEVLNDYALLLLDPSQKDQLTDSLNIALLTQLNVMTFEPVTIGFSTLSQTGSTHELQNQRLLRRISQLYTNQFAVIKEYGAIDRAYVVNSIFPYYAKHFPFAPNFNYTRQYANDPETFLELTKDDEFLNLVQQNGIIKTGFYSNFVNTLDSIRSIMVAIDQEVAVAP